MVYPPPAIFPHPVLASNDAAAICPRRPKCLFPLPTNGDDPAITTPEGVPIKVSPGRRPIQAIGDRESPAAVSNTVSSRTACEA